MRSASTGAQPPRPVQGTLDPPKRADAATRKRPLPEQQQEGAGGAAGADAGRWGHDLFEAEQQQGQPQEQPDAQQPQEQAEQKGKEGKEGGVGKRKSSRKKRSTR